MKLLPILILWAITAIVVSAADYGKYPIITSDGSIEHEQAKILVQTVPPEYYKHVDKIEFYESKVLDFPAYSWAKWDGDHNCYWGKIRMNRISSKNLRHELCHFHIWCELKLDYKQLGLPNEEAWDKIEDMADNCFIHDI
jgi:hypothetical protein